MKDIFDLLDREMRNVEGDMSLYSDNMDSCTEFSKEYWKYRDKYTEAFIIKTYLCGLKAKIIDNFG